MAGPATIETTHAWHFNDLPGRARTEKEGLGVLGTLIAAATPPFFSIMLRTTSRIQLKKTATKPVLPALTDFL